MKQGFIEGVAQPFGCAMPVRISDSDPVPDRKAGLSNAMNGVRLKAADLGHAVIFRVRSPYNEELVVFIHGNGVSEAVLPVCI